MPNFAPTSPLNLNLQQQSLQNQVQALKSAGIQPRPTSQTPNAVLTNGSATVPQHVSGVTAIIKKTSDVNSKVTVSFQRAPHDYRFVDASVYVSGYKGNPSPVKVANGQSPISFSLENTGDTFSIAVQANGPTGSAPLSSAPTTSAKLVYTPLANTPTTGGNGTFIDAPPPTIADIGGGFWGPGILELPGIWGAGGLQTTSSNAAGGIVTANQVTVYRFTLPVGFTISKITTKCQDNVFGHTATFGIYNRDGNLVLDGGTFPTTLTLGSNTLVTPVTLPAGVYLHAQAANSNAGNFHFPGVNAGGAGVVQDVIQCWGYNAGGRAFTAANPLVAGRLPATLGTLTPFAISNANGDGCCAPLYEV